MSDQPLLGIREIHAYYGSLHVLKGVSLEVGEGEIVALLGANGAGKSTTLRTINGLVRAAEGAITYAGQDLTTMLPHDIARIGIAHILEGRRLFPHMSVVENIQMGAFRRSDDEVAKDLEEIRDAFPGLARRWTRPAGTLSGGEQQMAALGRALMARPRLLMLDEPTMGLAPVIAQHVFSVLRDVSSRGTTILLVEQNAALALALADRAYVLETGSIVLSGRSADLATDEHVVQAYLGGLEAAADAPDGHR